MHSLSDLIHGKLAGSRRIRLAAGLDSIPEQLFELADTLEVLDLSGNRLSALPDDFSCLHKLRILFLSDNCFEDFPTVLAECPALTMIGFKANRITHLPEHALPIQIRWLILTDNRITSLPDCMGSYTQLQKLMLAGNQLTELPASMAACQNLELLRISANRLTSLPEWLCTLPRLSWLAFAGNPCSNQAIEHHDIPEIHWHELEHGELLGEGASGLISAARWQDDCCVAVKTFKGEVTSDGFPQDEKQASLAAGRHANLIEVLGRVGSHPEGKRGLILAQIGSDYKNLAGPPDFDSCTRDTYPVDCCFDLPVIQRIARDIASAAAHLHTQGIMHGDLYGHNILINAEGHCLLGDFGAASNYNHLDTTVQHSLQQLEVRAFGCLLEDLLQRVSPVSLPADATMVEQLETVRQQCMQKKTTARPLFGDIVKQL